MKASRSEKLELELDAAEQTLERKLLQLLPAVAQSGANLFTSSEFNPANLGAHLFHQDAEALLVSARECVRLREFIGLDTAGSVGALFLAACEEHASKNEQRRGPRKLAAALLQAVKDTSRSEGAGSG